MLRPRPLATLAALLPLACGAGEERADLVLNNGAEVATLDPATVAGVPEGRVMMALYEGLTVLHPRTLEPLPGCAERWEVSPDGLRVTFHLRAEARWSNGDPLSASDFAWSWRRLLEPATGAENAAHLWCVRGARAYSLLPDDRWYGSGRLAGLWLRELGDGRVRLGVDGLALERERERLGDGAAGAALATPLAAGDALGAGAPLVALEGRALAGLDGLEGRVLAVHEGLALGPLAQEPYERGWVLEARLADGALAAARARGELLDAAAAREALFWPAVGVRVPDERTLALELTAPTPWLLVLTALYPTYPVHRATLERARALHPDSWQAEWVRPGTIVTNGPYTVVERRVNDRLRLARNPLYWDQDAVALRTIDVLAVEHYGTMLNLYLTGAVDWVDRLAPSLVPRLRGREDFDPRPTLGTYFYRVNVARPPFDDARVRRALALAIDRRAIVRKVTKKDERPLWSLCPPGLAGYRAPELPHATPVDGADEDEAFAADLAAARALLAEAGYPDGRGFPTFAIHYNTSEQHRDIAEVVAAGWRRWLGLDARLANQEWKVYLETQKDVAYDVSRSSWIADYPDPSTFLGVFVSGGENNRTGWSDARYDALVAQAAREPDPARRLALLARAEALLLEELPILPVYSYVSQNLVNPRLGGFHENALDLHFPRFWYWKSDAELARERAALPPGVRVVPAPGPAAGLYARGGPPPRELE